MLAWVLTVIVCPSVCPSHDGIVPKRLNVGSRKQRHVIAQGLAFLCHHLGELRGNVHGSSMARWKAHRMVDFLLVLIELFSPARTVEVL